MTTPVIGLDELVQSQAQPHLLINRTSRKLEQFATMVRVLARDLTAPPSPTEDGDAYIVADSAAGAWAGHDGEIAYYAAGWKFISPLTGWLAYVVDEDKRYEYSAASPHEWVEFTTGGGGGGSLTVTDGVTTVVDVTTLLFAGDAAVSEVTGGVAGVMVTAVSGGGGGGAPNSIDDPPSVPNAADDEFYGASLDTTGSRFSGATPWSPFNQGSATYTLSKGVLVINAPAAAGNNWRGISQPISGNGRWRAKLASAVKAVQYNNAGLGFYRAASNRLVSCSAGSDSGGNPSIGTMKMNSPSSFNGSSLLDMSRLFGGVAQFRYFEIEYDGTSIYFRASGTGAEGTFIPIGIGSESASGGHLNGAPDTIVLWAESNNGSNDAALVVDWFRKLA